MADPDGVATGGVRFNKNGYDLNRNWDTIDAAKMPEIASASRAVLDWVDSGHTLALFLSLHKTETSEYLEAPSQFRALGEPLLHGLVETTTFHPVGGCVILPKPRRLENRGVGTWRKDSSMIENSPRC